MSKKRFLQGTLILTCAGLLTRFMGFFYRIFLSHAIGAQGIGVYQLAMPLQGLVMALAAVGMQAAISRLCASRMALGQQKEARDYFLLGTGTAVLFSVVLSFIIYKNSGFFASQILKEPRTQPLIRILSFSFPLTALHSCINSYYYSQKQTALPSGIQLLEQAARIGGSYVIYLVFLSEGREITSVIAAGGALFSEIIASIVSLIAVGADFRKHHYSLKKISSPLGSLKSMVEMAVPHSMNRLLLTLLHSMEVVLIPQRLLLSGLGSEEALAIYGVFTGMALPLILFPSTITNSASLMLMPSVAELQALGYKKRIDYVINRTCRCCFLLGAGCSLCFFFFGMPMGILLFGSPTAGTYIKALAFFCPFFYMNTALTSILNGLGKPNTCLIHSVIGVSLRIGFVLFAIPALGIRGYFYGMLLSELLLSVLHLHALTAMKK